MLRRVSEEGENALRLFRQVARWPFRSTAVTRPFLLHGFHMFYLFSAAHVNLTGSFLHLAYVMRLCPHPAHFGCVGGGSMLPQKFGVHL